MDSVDMVVYWLLKIKKNIKSLVSWFNDNIYHGKIDSYPQAASTEQKRSQTFVLDICTSVYDLLHHILRWMHIRHYYMDLHICFANTLCLGDNLSLGHTLDDTRNMDRHYILEDTSILRHCKLHWHRKVMGCKGPLRLGLFLQSELCFEKWKYLPNLLIRVLLHL